MIISLSSFIEAPGGGGQWQIVDTFSFLKDLGLILEFFATLTHFFLNGSQGRTSLLDNQAMASALLQKHDFCMVLIDNPV